jgi:hypothetical protein
LPSPPRKKKHKEMHREVVEITIFFRSKLYSFVLERKRKELSLAKRKAFFQFEYNN